MPIPLVTRILVADDHPIVRSRAEDACSTRSPTSRSSPRPSDGAEAVRKALAEDVDLAILDVAMPKLTGLQAAAELHKRRPELQAADAVDVRQRAVPLRVARGRRLRVRAQVGRRPRHRRRLPRGRCAASRSSTRPRSRRSCATTSSAAAPTTTQFDVLTPRELQVAEADRRGPHARRRSRGARDQHQDRRAAPPEHPRQARHERPRRAHALRDPPRPDPALADHRGSRWRVDPMYEDARALQCRSVTVSRRKGSQFECHRDALRAAARRSPNRETSSARSAGTASRHRYRRSTARCVGRATPGRPCPQERRIIRDGGEKGPIGDLPDAVPALC